MSKIKDEAVLDRYRGPGICEYCGKRVRNRHPHHLWTRGIGGGSRLDVAINLMALCEAFSGGDDCHQRLHDGNIRRADLLEVVARREGLTPDEIRERIWVLQRS